MREGRLLFLFDYNPRVVGLCWLWCLIYVCAVCLRSPFFFEVDGLWVLHSASDCSVSGGHILHLVYNTWMTD